MPRDHLQVETGARAWRCNFLIQHLESLGDIFRFSDGLAVDFHPGMRMDPATSTRGASLTGSTRTRTCQLAVEGGFFALLGGSKVPPEVDRLSRVAESRVAAQGSLAEAKAASSRTVTVTTSFPFRDKVWSPRTAAHEFQLGAER